MTPGARGAPAATIPQVADLAGVSRATAARALGGYGSVSEQARRRRDPAAAAELGYRANGVARAMITGRTMTFGLVLGDIENDFFAKIARGFGDVARAAGYLVLVSNTDEDVDGERSAVKLLLERRVDGLVVAPASMRSRDHLEAVAASGTSLVLVDRKVPGLAADTVVVDNQSAAHQAVAHLVAAGHTRIGMILGTGATPSTAKPWSSVSTSSERLRGYTAALAEAGIPFRPEYVRPGDFHLQAGRERTVALLTDPDPPTAVFATDSVLSLGVLLGLRDLRLRAPDDVSVVGFDDADWAPVVQPPMTVLAQPVYELGAAAAHRLIARVRGDGARPRAQRLRTALVARASVGPPRAGALRTASG